MLANVAFRLLYIQTDQKKLKFARMWNTSSLSMSEKYFVDW